jgi:uncharacterized protein
MLKVSQLYIYPIKSLAGIAMTTSKVTDRGLEYDRRWMIVDENNRFISLREQPKMTLLHPEIIEGGIKVNAIEYGQSISIQKDNHKPELIDVTIWNATVQAHEYPTEINEWFSQILNTSCRLVYMPDNSTRPVDTDTGYHPEGKITSFSDAYPFLMLSEESMADLNSRFDEPMSILRFRPNIVITGGEPYMEDQLEDFVINDVQFTGLENCGRCGIPNVDPSNATIGKDPLVTLSKYRLRNKQIEFGRNIVHTGLGSIHIGDPLIL